MTDTAMQELIEKFEQASEPSRELFEAAYIACHGPVDWGPGGNWRPFRNFLDFISVGAWTDAALTLVPEGWAWLVSNRAGRNHNARALVRIAGAPDIDLGANTPAIALCIAALKARQAMQAVTANQREND